jgi:hypothetical protein
MSEIDYAARVAKGVALLDEKRPGWERQIDLETLNIRNGYCCVTAQLSGESRWYVGMEQLGLSEGDYGTYVAHGFNAESYLPGDQNYDSDDVYPVLNSLWRDVVTERLTAAQPD